MGATNLSPSILTLPEETSLASLGHATESGERGPGVWTTGKYVGPSTFSGDGAEHRPPGVGTVFFTGNQVDSSERFG